MSDRCLLFRLLPVAVVAALLAAPPLVRVATG